MNDYKEWRTYLGNERGVGVCVVRAGRQSRLRRLGRHPRSRAARRADRRRRPPLLQFAGAVLLFQAETLPAIHRDNIMRYSVFPETTTTTPLYTWNNVFLMVEDRSEKDRRLAGGSSLRDFKTKPPRPSSSLLSRSAAGSAPAPPPLLAPMAP